MALMTLNQEEVDRFARNFEALFNQGDAAAMASYYTERAEILASDSDAVRGRHAIEEFWRAACQGANKAGVRRTIDVRHIERSGNLGYVLSTVSLEVPAGDRPATNVTFNDVTVWRLSTQDGWQIVVDSAVRTAPLGHPMTSSNEA